MFHLFARNVHRSRLRCCGWLVCGVLLLGAAPTQADFLFTTLSESGLSDTQAFCMNAPEQIVGAYHDENSVYHGFLLSGDEYTTMDVPGSAGTFVDGTNDLGQIVGYYLDANGTTHSFLATPVPEPCTLLLLGIGMLGMMGGAGRVRLSF